jgi:trehalose-phosphatase
VVAANLRQQLGAGPLLLLTDYDGTLSELSPTPEQAVLATDVRQEMDRVAALPAVTFGVVSGRRLGDVLERVGPAAAFGAGLHGLEICGPGCAFHHHALETVHAVIASLAASAGREMTRFPGVYLENKVYALTCHVRLVPNELASLALETFATLAEPYLESLILKSLIGTKALELLPNVDWHKGRAVTWIRARVEERFNSRVPVVYLGDDRTDEDAFGVLTDGDVAIGVGERPHTALIDWRLAGPSSVGRLFRHLTRLRADAPVAVR